MFKNKSSVKPNTGPLNNVTIIKRTIVLARKCGLFSTFPKTIPP